mgnify:CR=1 FL=1
MVGNTQVGGLAPGAADLVATALAISEGDAPPVVLVFADLHCGGAALWRELSRITGVPLQRLILAGTHTHAGPGHTYGSAVYNAMCTPAPWPWPVRAGALARQIAPAVRQAVEGRVVGGLALSRVPAWGIASNRAVPAVMRLDLREVGAFAKVGPGQGAPPGIISDGLRDPRVSTLVAFDQRGRPFGALATVAIHGTASGPAHPHWSADWAGPGRTLAEEGLGDVIVGYAGGSSGDVSPLPLDEEGEVRTPTAGPRAHISQGPELARVVGEGVAEALQTAVHAAEPGPVPVSVAHTMWRPEEDPRLGLPTPGLATAGGGIDGTRSDAAWEALGTGVHGSGYQRVASKALPPPQHPKVPIQFAESLGAIPVAQLASRLGPRSLPLHAVALGDVTLVTVPGEPSTFVGWRIERAVRKAVGGRVVVLGYAGDYAGYWVTPEAYDEQRYEGASTLFGRLASTALQEQLVHLARQARYASPSTSGA